jgi:hypothetical protein
MNRNLRTKKASSVNRSLEVSSSYRGDQRAVWEGIASCAMMANVHTATRAMSDIYESKEGDLKGYLDVFQPIPHQNGIFVMVNGRVAGFDVLSLESAYEAIHPKLVKSYAMDALISRSGRDSEPSIDRARSFIEEVAQCEEKKFKSMGHGWDYRFEGKGIVGSSLVHQEKVIHLAFFKTDQEETTGGISSSSARRKFRL